MTIPHESTHKDQQKMTTKTYVLANHVVGGMVSQKAYCTLYGAIQAAKALVRRRALSPRFVNIAPIIEVSHVTGNCWPTMAIVRGKSHTLVQQ